jgi:basic amino acid/polyamine antiporter, APA family
LTSIENAATLRAMSQHPVQTERGLVRAIGLRGLSANIVNSTVGAGIFVLPAIVARDLGTAAPLAYLACAVAMMLVCSSIAIAGSRVSVTGGMYAYVEVAFGPLVGFLIGFVVWLSCLMASASVANAFAGSAATIAPAAGTEIGKAVLLAAVYATLAMVNVRGVAAGNRVVELVTLAKLLPLVLLLAVGVFHVRGPDLTITWAPPANVATTSVTLIFAFMGVEYALLPSGEVQAPARTIPRALLIALLVTTLLYLAVQFVAHAILGADLARFANAPLAEAASRVVGPWGGALILVGGAISMMGMLSGDALTTPRSLFAFARDGFLPSPLARVHPRYHTPWIAIVAHATIVWLAATIGTFDRLLMLSTASMLIAYFLCCAAAIELKRRDVRMSGTPFELPGGSLLAVAACVVLAWLASHASGAALGVTAATLTVAAVLYAIREIRTRNGRRSASPAAANADAL